MGKMNPQMQKLQIMPPSASYYPVDDMPLYVEKIEKLYETKERKLRSDLTSGMIVVVLDGEHMGKRVVYLKNNGVMAVCIGPSSINNVPMFSIDERFLFKTSTVVNIGNLNLDVEATPCSMDILSKSDNTPSEAEKKIESHILKEVSKVKYLKTYLKSMFSLPGGDAMRHGY